MPADTVNPACPAILSAIALRELEGSIIEGSKGGEPRKWDLRFATTGERCYLCEGFLLRLLVVRRLLLFPFHERKGIR